MMNCRSTMQAFEDLTPDSGRQTGTSIAEVPHPCRHTRMFASAMVHTDADVTHQGTEMTTKTERPRVLLVDDYPDAREMYTEYLEFSGFDVVQASNGMEALERAAEDTPDIILMDLSLPVMDGWEATRRLKADARP